HVPGRTDTQNLVALMFGRTPPPVASGNLPARAGTSVPVLELVDAAASAARLDMAGVTLQVPARGSPGLARPEGRGQRQFLRACAGLNRVSHGRIAVGGRDMTVRAYADFLDAGVAYVPAGRLDEALIPGLTLTEHAALADRRRTFFVDWAAASRSAARR